MLHEVQVTLPKLPASLQGLRIAHLSDLHIHRRRLRHARIARHLAQLQVDLALLTGDYICEEGDEQVALEVMADILKPLRPRLGIFGVFGNHDTQITRELFQSLPVHWLEDCSHQMPELNLQLLGFAFDKHREPDSIATISHMLGNNGHAHAGGEVPVRMLLCHKPTCLPTAGDMNVDLMFCGHTHGGQMRLPFKRAIVNSCDLPAGLTSGILRHRDTLCVVSRGLGESWLQMRLFCGPQIPIYTLQRGRLPGEHTQHIINVQPW